MDEREMPSDGTSVSLACGKCAYAGECESGYEPCAGVELLSNEQHYYRYREHFANLSKILTAPNPIFELGATAAHPFWGVSSEPPCVCPEGAISPKCKRHEYMKDYVGQDPFKDHLKDYAVRQAVTDAGVPQALWATLFEQWHKVGETPMESLAPVQSAWHTEHDKLMDALVSETAMPGMFMQPLDDVLLSYSSISGERYMRLRKHVPRKYTRRERFRIWRHEMNRRVQQHIHDHWLPEAYCDC